MLHGKVVRPSAFHAKLVSCDTSQAEKVPGVSVVHDGDFIGVSAMDVMTTGRASQAIRAQWDAPPQISDRELFDHLRKGASDENDNKEQFVLGSVEQSRAQASKTLQQTYTVAYIAHTPMKSPSCTTLTPGIFSACDVSHDINFAWNALGRTTFPCSIPGRPTSVVYWCAPVTKSRPFAFGADAPATFQSLAGVSSGSSGINLASFCPCTSSA